MTCTPDITPRRCRVRGALGLSLSALLVLGSLAGAADAAPHGGGGGGHGGGRGGGGGHSYGGGSRGGGYRGGGGWGGDYYQGSPLVYDSPYYCAPPLIYRRYRTPYGYCQ